MRNSSFLKANLHLILIPLVVVTLHILTNNQYGFHRDELDLLMNARQLDWGYVAYPPLSPFLARIGLELFGSSLRGLRVFPALAQGIVVLLTMLMARDFDAKRPGQIVAGLSAGIAPVAMVAGTLLQYMSFDYLWWVVVAFFLVRLIKTTDPRWWLGVGTGIGLGMMTKFTIVFWAAGVVVAVLATPLRRYLRSRWLWLGAALALLIYLPNLIWQIQHNFISLDFLAAIHARDIAWGRTEGFLTDQLYATTSPTTLPLWIIGLFFCFFSNNGKTYRPLAYLFLTTFFLLLVSRGRGYYLAPAYAMLLAAGSARWEYWLTQRSARHFSAGWQATWITLSISFVTAVVIMKPVVPINSALWPITSDINDNVVEMIGWQELTAQIAQIYADIPQFEKPKTVILAGNYGEAGALDLYGSEYDLPPVISGSNSLWQRGYGNFEPESVIVVGFERQYADHFFKVCKQVGTISNQYGVRNEESSFHTSLFICHQPRQSWEVLWTDMQWFQ
jgi:hypothetical protein